MKKLGFLETNYCCMLPSLQGFKLGSERHTTEVMVDKSGTLRVTSGIEGLSILKTTKVIPVIHLPKFVSLFSALKDGG